ncbi:hypothetical protein [Flavobacterium sufflavum]|nr:hypothetical protein [Flavobacterium sufflavum]
MAKQQTPTTPKPSQNPPSRPTIKPGPSSPSPRRGLEEQKGMPRPPKK